MSRWKWTSMPKYWSLWKAFLVNPFRFLGNAAKIALLVEWWIVNFCVSGWGRPTITSESSHQQNNIFGCLPRRNDVVLGFKFHEELKFIVPMVDKPDRTGTGGKSCDNIVMPWKVELRAWPNTWKTRSWGQAVLLWIEFISASIPFRCVTSAAKAICTLLPTHRQSLLVRTSSNMPTIMPAKSVRTAFNLRSVRRHDRLGHIILHNLICSCERRESVLRLFVRLWRGYLLVGTCVESWFAIQLFQKPTVSYYLHTEISGLWLASTILPMPTIPDVMVLTCQPDGPKCPWLKLNTSLQYRPYFSTCSRMRGVRW